MKDKEMPICVDCIHAYVCEEYNLNRDMLRKRCVYHNDHFLDTKNSVVLSKEEYEKLKYAWITDSDAYKKGSKETAEKYKVAMILSIQEMQKYLELTEKQAKILYHHNNEIAKKFIVE